VFRRRSLGNGRCRVVAGHGARSYAPLGVRDRPLASRDSRLDVHACLLSGRISRLDIRETRFRGLEIDVHDLISRVQPVKCQIRARDCRSRGPRSNERNTKYPSRGLESRSPCAKSADAAPKSWSPADLTAVRALITSRQLAKMATRLASSSSRKPELGGHRPRSAVVGQVRDVRVPISYERVSFSYFLVLTSRVPVSFSCVEVPTSDVLVSFSYVVMLTRALSG
jgi:hypothetical protein